MTTIAKSVLSTMVVLAVSALLLASCSDAEGPAETSDASEGATTSETTVTTEASTPASESATPTEAADSEAAATGEIDCAAVGETLTAWVEASFSAASTEVTNGEVAAEYMEASDAFAAAAVSGAEQWDDLGAVIDEYVAQWSALPADGGAFENAETVEAEVDAFAAGIGFDNDNFENMTPIVGEACGAQLEGLFGG